MLSPYLSLIWNMLKCCYDLWSIVKSIQQLKKLMLCHIFNTFLFISISSDYHLIKIFIISIYDRPRLVMMKIFDFQHIWNGWRPWPFLCVCVRGHNFATRNLRNSPDFCLEIFTMYTCYGKLSPKEIVKVKVKYQGHSDPFTGLTLRIFFSVTVRPTSFIFSSKCAAWWDAQL